MNQFLRTTKPEDKHSPFSGFLPTRAEAIRHDHKFYFIGKPCIHGHICLRYTINRACLICSRIHSAESNAQLNLPKNSKQKKKYNKAAILHRQESGDSLRMDDVSIEEMDNWKMGNGELPSFLDLDAL